MNPCEWAEDEHRFRLSLHLIQIKRLGIEVEFWKCVVVGLLFCESIAVLTCFVHVMTFGSNIEEAMLLTFAMSLILTASSMQLLLVTSSDQTLEFLNGLILFDTKLGKSCSFKFNYLS